MEKLIQWFPGHIAKAQRELREKISMVDCVIELVDARMPVSSHFPFIDEIASHKQRVMVINKTDLAPPDLTRKAIAYWQEQGFPAVALEVPSRKGIPELTAILDRIHAQLSEKMKKRGRLPRKLRTMVMGLPNVGKSSLINALIKKRKLKVSDKPGVTRSMQWSNIGKNLELLDTPGVIPPKFEDQTLALKLALIGSISEYAADPAQVAEAGLDLMRESFPGMLTRIFGTEQYSLEQLSAQRGFLQHGGVPDMRRSAESFLQDIRHARHGRFDLESYFHDLPLDQADETDDEPLIALESDQDNIDGDDSADVESDVESDVETNVEIETEADEVSDHDVHDSDYVVLPRNT